MNEIQAFNDFWAEQADEYLAAHGGIIQARATAFDDWIGNVESDVLALLEKEIGDEHPFKFSNIRTALIQHNGDVKAAVADLAEWYRDMDPPDPPGYDVPTAAQRNKGDI